METDPRIDAYIARQADFARPILDHIRRLMHGVGLDLAETIKWGMPHFTYKGRPFAGMAAFKAHATLGLWNGKGLVKGTGAGGEAMGQFGRLTAIADLPPEAELAEILRRAAAAADAGITARPKKPPKPELPAPDDLRAALDSDPRAAATFDSFPPGSRREYVEWVVEAKRPETRSKRVAQAVEWLAEGKRRNWKYENC